MNIKVSLVIPFYNSISSIDDCLSAAFNQTVNFFEIIVVDNNSFDHCSEVLRKYSSIKILSCEKQGAASARNCGWREASSDYIAFVDADTVISRDWNEQMIKHLENSHILAAQSRILPIESEASSKYLFKYRYAKKEQATRGTFIELNIEDKTIAINTAACVYKRSVLMKTLGFEERLLRLEDTDLALKASSVGLVSACLSATASVRFDGNTFNYLKRSFNDGVAQNVFNQLWGVDKINHSFFSKTKGFYLFEFLNNILFFIGFNYGQLFGQSYSQDSLNLTRLIRRTKS
jgi:glycosyltransferase involved in cell wall biosynthesis